MMTTCGMTPPWWPVYFALRECARMSFRLPVPTVTTQHFPNDQIVVIPIRDMPPVPLGLIWRTRHEKARIRALAKIARSLPP